MREGDGLDPTAIAKDKPADFDKVLLHGTVRLRRSAVVGAQGRPGPTPVEARIQLTRHNSRAFLWLSFQSKFSCREEYTMSSEALRSEAYSVIDGEGFKMCRPEFRQELKYVLTFVC